MSQLNTNKSSQFTHEGGKATQTTPYYTLRRSVLSCLLWEDSFYENGEDVFKRIRDNSLLVSNKQLADLAIEARHKYKLRHVSLLLLSILCRKGSGSRLVSETIGQVISRVDELTEFVAIHAKLNDTSPDKVKKTISSQMKKGLSISFNKFDEYQFAKYNRKKGITLKDVLFLVHPKPKNEEQQRIFNAIASDTLKTPDTWEVALSSGQDKKKTFERLLSEGNLGYLALLRNLRNMLEAGIDPHWLKPFIEDGKGKDKILPFQFIAAARMAPQLESSIDIAMQDCMKELPTFNGKTAVLVDISGSMNYDLSQKGIMTLFDAACALATMIQGDHVRIWSFSNSIVEVPRRFGMSLIDAIKNSQAMNGTDIPEAMATVNSLWDYDRIIVITDEQTTGYGNYSPLTGAKAYMINIGNYENGISYGNGWEHIDGFSENSIRFIHEIEEERS